MSFQREQLNTLKFGNIVSGEKFAPPTIPAKSCCKTSSYRWNSPDQEVADNE